MEDILIYRIQQDDQEAFEELLKNYSKMIYSIIKVHEPVYGDYPISFDDLFQEGSLALLEAAKTYNTDMETSFTTYAYTIIKRRTNRYYYLLVDGVKDECFSYSKFDNIDRNLAIATEYVSDNPIPYMLENDLKKEWEEKLRSYNEFDRELIRLKMEGYTYKAIASILKVSEKKVDNRIQKMRKTYNRMKLREARRNR